LFVRTSPWIQLDATIKTVERKWGGKNPKFQRAVDEWIEFRDKHFPKEHDSKEYVKANPTKYHVPFKEFFASPKVVVTQTKQDSSSKETSAAPILLQATAQPSVRYVAQDKTPKVPSRKLVDEDKHGIKYVDPVEKKKDASKWEDLLIDEWKLFGFGDKETRAKSTKKDMLKLLAETKNHPPFPHAMVKEHRAKKPPQNQRKVDAKLATDWCDNRLTKKMIANVIGGNNVKQLENKTKVVLIEMAKNKFGTTFPTDAVNQLIHCADKHLT
jgi:hypothetical protein